jgi:hypothetical protein
VGCKVFIFYIPVLCWKSGELIIRPVFEIGVRAIKLYLQEIESGIVDVSNDLGPLAARLEEEAIIRMSD